MRFKYKSLQEEIVVMSKNGLGFRLTSWPK